MAKTKKTREDHDEEIMKENIQKRFERMFTGEGEPLTNMSIQEVEALKSRVAELEAILEDQPAPSASLNSEAARRETPPSSVQRSREEREGLLQGLLPPPRLEDPAQNRIARLQHKLLLGLFAASILSMAALLWNWSSTAFLTMGMILFAITLLVMAAVWQRKGHVERASLVLVGTFNAILLFSVSQSGLGASNILLAAVLISLAGLLLRPSRVIVVTLMTIGILLAANYMVPAGQIDHNQLIFTALLLGLEGLLLTVASRTLEESFAEADRSTQDLRHANESLQELTGNLEQRVEERMHDLELASEVGRAVAEKIANTDEMLATAAELIRVRFKLYYAQIYLTDLAGQKLVLRAGTGDVGKQLLSRRHQLLIDSGSLNGQAVLEKKAIIVADTHQSEIFKPNALLPKTRSEMSVPLMAEGRVLGILDMQSEQPNTFSESNLAAFKALAGQLAIAIQNAKLFAEVEEARSEVEAQVRHFTEQGWQDFLNAIEREQKIGFAFDQSKIIRLQPETISIAENYDVSIPITVTGAKVGEIHLPVEQDRAWTPNEIELVKAAGTQLAQHIDNLRLLAQADQYRAEAQQAVRRLTREAWDSYLQTYDELEPGYVFDLAEVKPLDKETNASSSDSVRHSMIVRDEMIGELVVETVAQNEEVSEFLTAIGKQLSDHLENLRLSELNEKRAYREHALRQITSALRGSTNPATIMRTAVRELGSILGRRAVVQLAVPEEQDPAESTVTSQNQLNSSARRS